MKAILDEIRDRFYKRLEAKTGWGRNEIKELYNEVVLEVCLSHLNDGLP